QLRPFLFPIFLGPDVCQGGDGDFPHLAAEITIAQPVAARSVRGRISSLRGWNQKEKANDEEARRHESLRISQGGQNDGNAEGQVGKAAAVVSVSFGLKRAGEPAAPSKGERSPLLGAAGSPAKRRHYPERCFLPQSLLYWFGAALLPRHVRPTRWIPA